MGVRRLMLGSAQRFEKARAWRGRIRADTHVACANSPGYTCCRLADRRLVALSRRAGECGRLALLQHCAGVPGLGAVFRSVSSDRAPLSFAGTRRRRSRLGSRVRAVLVRTAAFVRMLRTDSRSEASPSSSREPRSPCAPRGRTWSVAACVPRTTSWPGRPPADTPPAVRPHVLLFTLSSHFIAGVMPAAPAHLLRCPAPS